MFLTSSPILKSERSSILSCPVSSLGMRCRGNYLLSHLFWVWRKSICVNRSIRQSFWAYLRRICKRFVWFVKSICCHTVWRQRIFSLPPQVRHHNNLKVANAQHGACVGNKLKHGEQSSWYFWPYVCKQNNIDFHECENASLLIILIIHMLNCFLFVFFCFCVTMTEL